MKKYSFTPVLKTILADTITPVSIYLKVRDTFPNAILLESSDYHSHSNSFSFIGLEPVAEFSAEDMKVKISMPDGFSESYQAKDRHEVLKSLHDFSKAFVIGNNEKPVIDGIFGYCGYDAVQYFEDLKFTSPKPEAEKIPELRFNFYRYIIAINHFRNELFLIENLFEGQRSKMDHIISLIFSRNFASYTFSPKGSETSNLTDEQYKHMVQKGKEHCLRGDVFQIVLSRQFSQQFQGDDFNVYRSLRSINPSPYLFYFDYGSYRIFGSSPETQIEIKGGKAYINPIAGTFKRTGDDLKDQELAEQLSKDPKENSEHIMLVDLARNDLSRTTSGVKVEKFREIQFYSHVLHMVSKVSGELPKDADTLAIMAESFPAGTLSGAPKFKAMQLIDKYENKARGFYGGSIGVIRLNGDINHAIMIRSFMSKDNTLYYQAGAGVVVASVEENELAEVNNKLAALKRAIEMAKNI